MGGDDAHLEWDAESFQGPGRVWERVSQSDFEPMITPTKGCIATPEKL